MRSLVALVVAVCLLAFAAPARAQPRRHRTTPVKHRVKKREGRRVHVRPEQPLASEYDEVVLSPALLRQLQRNLADAGYLRGTTDGRLTARTRRALAAFQRDYHLVGTGALDRASAEALLGRDSIGAYAVAAVSAQ